MKILVINSGSSSLKFTLFSMEKDEEKVLASGIVERLGLENPKIIYKNPAQEYKSEDNPPIPDYDTALQLICGKLTDPEHGVIRSFDEDGNARIVPINTGKTSLQGLKQQLRSLELQTGCEVSLVFNLQCSMGYLSQKF